MKHINKILLVGPPGTVFRQPDGTTQTKECIPSLGLAYLAAHIKNTCEVKVYDMVVNNFDHETVISKDTILYGATFDQYEQILADYKPDLVGIQCVLSSRSKSSLQLSKLTKEYNENVVTVMGGHHASALPDHVLKDGYTDYVLLGEADFSFIELINTLNTDGDITKIDGIAYRKGDTPVVRPQTIFVKDLDSLPYPDWDAMGIEKYWNGNLPMGVPLKSKKYAVINTSRGCPHNCYYCAVPSHTGKGNYRTKSLPNVMKELRWLISKYKVDEIQFQDDNFFVNKNRLKRLCKLLITNFPNIHFAVPTGTDLPTLDYELIDLLKKANFHHLMLGIETGDPDVQKEFVDKRINLEEVREKVKYIKDKELDPSGFFLMGFPNETRGQLQKTLELATSLDLDKIHLIMLTPIPGSKLYKDCIENDLLYDDFDVEKLRYTNSFIKNKNITRSEIERLRVEVWREYHQERMKNDSHTSV